MTIAALGPTEHFPMDYLTHIERESDVFLQTALDGSMDTAVPSCEKWTVTDLVGHLGTVQRFHGGHLLRGVTDPPEGPRPTPPDTGLAEWFRAGTEQLLANLVALGTTSAAWSMSLAPEDQVTGFWHRRMALEAAIHRWDAELARGRASGFATELALDGIAEVTDMWVPSKRRGDEPQGSVTINVTDAGTPITFSYGELDAATATITGSADDVWLALWGRIPLTDLDVTGDRDLAGSVRAR